MSQSQQAKPKESVAQTFFDDFFPEPFAAAAQPTAKCAQAPDGLRIDSFRSHAFAQKASVEAKPVVTMKSPGSNHDDLEDFLAMCNPAVQRQVVSVAAEDEDLFAGWES